MGVEEPHPGISQEKSTKPNFFRNAAETKTGPKPRALPPNQQRLFLLSWVFPEIPPVENPSPTPGTLERARNISGVYPQPQAPPSPCLAQNPLGARHGGGFCASFLPNAIPGAGTNNGSRKTSSMDLFPGSLLPCSSFITSLKGFNTKPGREL